jgi:hypothetical protein
VPGAALAGQGGGRAGDDGGQAGDDVNGEDGQEGGGSGARLIAMMRLAVAIGGSPLTLSVPICSNATYR